MLASARSDVRGLISFDPRISPSLSSGAHWRDPLAPTRWLMRATFVADHTRARDRRAGSTHPVQGAELVAVGIAQIGEIEFARSALAHTRRVLAGLAAIGDAGRMPRVGLLGGARGKTDRAAIGRGRRLAIDRLRHRENASFGHIENAMAVYPPGRNAERAEQRVIERLGLFQVVGSDHNMRKHPAFRPRYSPNDRSRSALNCFTE